MFSESLGWQNRLPDDDAARESEGEDDTVVEDLTGSDFFHELEHVNASDWDVDSDALWGDIGGDGIGGAGVVEIVDDGVDPDLPI